MVPLLHEDTQSKGSENCSLTSYLVTYEIIRSESIFENIQLRKSNESTLEYIFMTYFTAENLLFSLIL